MLLFVGTRGLARRDVLERILRLVAGLIQYSHGNPTITDRMGLERSACECYAVMRSEFEDLFAARPASA